MPTVFDVHANPGYPGTKQPGQAYAGATLAPHCVWCSAGVVVGRFAGAFSGSLRGLKLVPSKWRYLAPPASTPQGHTPLGKNALGGASQTPALGRFPCKQRIFYGIT
jgi:hypothetical protein